MQKVNLARVFGVALAAVFVAVSAAADEPDCSAWSLDGHSIGMPFDEAIEGKKKKLIGRKTYKVKKPHRGKLLFDDDFRLLIWKKDQVVGTRGDSLAIEEAIERLTDRFGEPEFHRKDRSQEPPDEAVGWRSEACDAAVLLKSQYYFAVDSLEVAIYLMRLSPLGNAPLTSIPEFLGE